MKKIRNLATGFALVLLFLGAIAVQVVADYHIYIYRETGSMGPWFDHIGTATSWMGGHVAYTQAGNFMFSNYTADGVPTTIYTANPPSGNCLRWGILVPCWLAQ
jgi:hypothetical protein